MTNNKSSIIDNQFKQFIQIAGSAQTAVSFQNRASSIKHRASSMQNKPNSPIVQLNLTPFIEMSYTISACLAKVKNKPNSNPIFNPRCELTCFPAGNPIPKAPEHIKTIAGKKVLNSRYLKTSDRFD
jgi:hypothetical protein